jgi:hypothetical protein
MPVTAPTSASRLESGAQLSSTLNDGMRVAQSIIEMQAKSDVILSFFK